MIKGILWHQGENDSGKEETAKIYETQLHAMITAWRKDLGRDNIPIVVGEMGRFFKRAKFKHVVDAALKALPGKVKHAAWVSAEGLEHKGDVVHFSAAGYREFGKRYAAKMQALVK